MHKRILLAICIVCLLATVASAEERLGVAVGGGIGGVLWKDSFEVPEGFATPKTVYNFYGGSEFRLNEKWLLRNLGQGIVYSGTKDENQTKLTVGMWTLSALRLWEVKPNLELGAGAMAGVGSFSLRLDYGQTVDPLEPNVRELTDKFFLSLAPIATLRYRVGIQTLTMEALYLLPRYLDYGMKSGWQVQLGLSYDLGY